MNRADQAREPSIEELLASIRHIITDADKPEPQRQETNYPLAPAETPDSSRQAGVAAEDVFDLTDEFIFPADLESGGPEHPALEGRGVQQPGPRQVQARGPGATPVIPENMPPQAVQPGGQKHTGKSPAAWNEGPVNTAAQVARPIWSRRELPAGPGPQPVRQHRSDAVPARPPQARNWAGDIQMPVPDQGPVSLFSAEAPRSRAGDPPVDAKAAEKPVPDGASAAPREGGEEAVAVAVLAQRLARSAMGVLEASELENARNVDFENLDAKAKAEVTEKFAEAIERETVPRKSPAEANAPADEQEAEPQLPPVKGTALEAPATASEPPPPHPKAGTEPHAEAPETQTAESPSEPELTLEPARLAPPPAESPAHAMKAAPARPAVAQSAPAPAVQPLAQAQFVGPAHTPISPQAGSSLESAVREMLRPLLVQWLNENMPRILENAIREEIAMRGLLPKSDS